MYVVAVWLKCQFMVLKSIGYEELFRFYHCSGSLTRSAEPTRGLAVARVPLTPELFGVVDVCIALGCSSFQ